jgi:N-dimethylarginine dimethylaminohydrolase
MENMTSNESVPTVNCTNEYDRLKLVITVSPQYMKIEEVINNTQQHYLTNNIDTNIALQQHETLTNTLKEHGAQVIQLEAKENLNEQVFTRDIGFTIGDTFFVSSMKVDMRKPEIAELINWLESMRIPFQIIDCGSIEGGDVIVDNKNIWIGISNRTSHAAVTALQQMLPAYNIKPIQLREDILHLDCVFNIISEDTALIYEAAIESDGYKHLKQSYQLIEVTEEEQFKMGPNVLSIGGKKIISMPENKRLNRVLTQAGYHVVEIEFSEIIKSGGSFRCCSLPLIRE